MRNKNHWITTHLPELIFNRNTQLLDRKEQKFPIATVFITELSNNWLIFVKTFSQN